jgi:hypothetical protein
VLVGVSGYSFLESLPAVANNLPAMATALASKDSWGLPEGHCTIVAEPASGQEVIDIVWQQAQEITDTLLFYFAGHGLVDSRGELLLALPGSRRGRSHHGIPYQWLRDAMSEGRAQRYVVILDCCFSGRALGLMSGTDDLLDTAQIDGSYLLAAAGENAAALAPPGEQHTAFTGQLLHLLAQGIPGGPAELDLDTVYHHLRRQLAASGRPVPHKRDRNTAGSLVLARNPAYRPAAGARRARQEPAAQARWPDPASFTTPGDFLQGLVMVRAEANLQVGHVADRAGLSAGTVSALTNRSTLPARWATTNAYLRACGLTTEQTAAWKQAWQRLRALPPSPAAAPARPPAAARAHLPRRRWRRGAEADSGPQPR